VVVDAPVLPAIVVLVVGLVAALLVVALVVFEM
jgi:hypothetical protein